MVTEYLKQGSTPSVAARQAREYLASKDGKAAVAKLEATLNAGGNVKSSTFGTVLSGVLSSALEGVKNGVKTGVGTALGGVIATGINKGGTAIFGSKPVKNIGDTIAGFGADALGKTLLNFIKKYWYLMIIPFGLTTLLIVKLVQSIFKSNGRKSKSYRK